MELRSFALSSVAATSCAVILVAGGCSGRASETGGDDAWVGTITSEGDVTTVVTESGSVWGGSAELVEEASIGVDAGDEAYMFARIGALAADDRHIYVLERSPPVVRVYDLDGVHLRNIGREGQGPGEFSFPSSLVIMPDGRLMVRDDDNARISFFSADGELLDSWPLSGGFGTSRASFVMPDGTLYSPQPIGRDADNRAIWGMVPYGPNGEPGEPIPNPESTEFEGLRFGRTTVTSSDGRVRSSGGGLVPFSPRAIADFSPVGATISGTSDRYRFEVRYFDGRTLVVERRLEPVGVVDEEAAWTRRYITALRRNGDPTWSWNGPDIPDRKGYFEFAVGDADGRVWLSRNGPGIRAEPCDENPVPGPSAEIVRCWTDSVIVDIFGADGRFLGDLTMPVGYGVYDLRRAFIRGEMVLMQTEDEAGTIVVKRYRLALPGT